MVPDRVPTVRIGRASSLVAIGVNSGIVGGSVVFAVFPELAGPVGYYLMAFLIVAAAVVFAVVSPDSGARDLPRKPFRLELFLCSFWVDPRKHRDFAWVFLSRLLLMLGYFLFFAYFYFALQDYVRLSASGAVTAAGVMYAVNGAAAVGGPVLAGLLVDRIPSLKLFVVVSGVLLAASALIPLAMPSYEGMMAFSVVNGFAFGVYWAVDTTLVNRVLPQAQSAAKDLGIMNLTQVIPQVASGALGAVLVSLVGYGGMFAFCGAVSILGALVVLRVRSVQ